MTTDTPDSVRDLARSIGRKMHIGSVTRGHTINVLTRYAESLGRTCEWRHDDIDGDYYTTGCGNAYTFIDGGPKDNKQVWCGYCGARIVEVRE